MKVEIEVTGCKDCPHLASGRTYGNDGRDGDIVYLCKKGAFGKDSEHYTEGRITIPKVPPLKCPYFKSNAIDRIADRLNITTDELEKVLNDEECLIMEKSSNDK